MRFSIKEPIRLLRRLHGCNPKAKTHFLVRMKSDQMEITPLSAMPGKRPNEVEVHGEEADKLRQLAETLQYYGAGSFELFLVTNRRVQSGQERQRKEIALNAHQGSWRSRELGAILPFLCPDDVQWKVDVRFDGPAAHTDAVWVSNEEICRILRAQPLVAASLQVLRQGELQVPLR